MSSGEMPRGAAKGRQSDTKALCQTPAPGPPVKHSPGVVGLQPESWPAPRRKAMGARPTGTHIPVQADNALHAPP